MTAPERSPPPSIPPPSPDVGGGVSGLAIRRPVFTSMVMIGLMVLGAFGLSRLAIDQFPEVEIPVVSVQTVYTGASPETVEREVTRSLEEAFNTVEGVDTITSTSLEGISQIIIEFELERDVDQAAQDIRGRIDTVRRDLPEDIEPPVVQKFDPAAQPIVSLALSSNTLPLVQLTTLADEQVRRRLESVQGVGSVQLTGGLEREVRIYLLPEELQALDVSVPQVMEALRQQNLEVPAGRIESGATERLVRITGRFREVREFADVIVADREGNPVRLGQVARIEDATEEERSLALFNDQRTVSLDILKVAGANTVAVAERVQAAVESLRPSLPAGVDLRVVRDNSVDIRESVRSVQHELILGAILTVVVVMLFLNDWRATLITALALPVSVISSFVLMYALGFTLNMLTLMALSLSIGILIDDAIVVVENIARHRAMGKDSLRAAGEGTREIFLAVLATTLSIVAVFVPVAFMGGVIGRFFFQFGITVAWAVLVSLLVSFTLTPMLSARWGLGPHVPEHATGSPLRRAIGAFNRGFDRLAERYRGVIDWSLRHRRTTVAIALGSFAASLALFPYVGGGFTPVTDESQFTVQFETPEGSSLAYTRGKAEQLTEMLRAIPGVAYTYTTVGAGVTGTVTGGSIYVRLTGPGERDLSQQELMTTARERLSPVAGVDLAVLEAGGLGGAQAPIQVQLNGPEVDELQRIASRLVETMERIPGLVDVDSSLGRPRPELRIEVNRDVANAVGLNIGQIVSSIRPVLAGQTATTWEDPGGEERDVVVQVAPEERMSVESLRELPLPAGNASGTNGTSGTVPLGEVARIEVGAAPQQVNRRNLERVATISASTASGASVSEVTAAIRQRIAGLELPQGYAVRFGGDTEALEETSGYALQAILLAIIFIFLILASQFESVSQPFAVMVSLPLALVGVLLALLLTNDTLNLMSMIGVIMLMGLVTKNAILLIDNANERRARGVDRHTALVEAGQVRLRPIIMTTLAMIFGMLPIALALGEGGGFRAPMARAVIGGLITSTLLTLIVVPVAYTYFDSFGPRMRSIGRRLRESRDGWVRRSRAATPESRLPAAESHPRHQVP